MARAERPAIIAGSAVQVNVLLNTIFASYLVTKDGPVSWLNYAFRLMQLPLGVFGVAVRCGVRCCGVWCGVVWCGVAWGVTVA